jgi:ATP-binding protein involved in chromosome partitioning
MAGFTSGDGVTHQLFGEGGGQRLADELGVPLIGSIPIEAAVAAGGDSGTPTVDGGTGPAAQAIRAIATRIRIEIAPPVAATELAGCTAHMLAAVSAALDAKDTVAKDATAENTVEPA